LHSKQGDLRNVSALDIDFNQARGLHVLTVQEIHTKDSEDGGRISHTEEIGRFR